LQIIAQCPSCGSSRLLDVSDADKRIRCGKCHLLFKVPKLEDVPRAVRIIKQTRGRIFVDQDGKTYG